MPLLAVTSEHTSWGTRFNSINVAVRTVIPTRLVNVCRLRDPKTLDTSLISHPNETKRFYTFASRFVLMGEYKLLLLTKLHSYTSGTGKFLRISTCNPLIVCSTSYLNWLGIVLWCLGFQYWPSFEWKYMSSCAIPKFNLFIPPLWTKCKNKHEIL